MSNYFRITGYYKAKDVCFIADSNGKFQALWEFSAFLVKMGIEIVAVEKVDRLNYSYIVSAEQNTDCIFLRACDMGRPNTDNGMITIRGQFYTARSK
ncbi:MAG: hypothetical protein NC548_40795 [Lachnospiraceae bacterium]|nr:hypothetical protein [Lachnospiraceae bacterium]